MTKKLRFLFVILYLLTSSCTRESNNAEVAINSSVDSTNQGTPIAPPKGVNALLQIKLQIERGDYRQLESFINQVQAYLETDSIQNSAEERSDFPKLSQEIMIDFLRSIDAEAFSQSRYHEKEYSFNIAPKGYKANSKECPDWIRLSADENTNEFNLLLNSSFLVNSEFGCAESSTIYVFRVEDGRLLLKLVDFAG